MSRTHKDRPTRFLDAQTYPGSWWSNWRNEWVFPYSMYAPGPPRWYRHETWYGPERLRERDILCQMVKDYNTNGDIQNDGDFVNRQHRHDAGWHWW